jgi:peroxin-6
MLTRPGRKDPVLSTEGRASMLTSPGSPFKQIRDVLAATLHPAASDYKLAVTVLVTGNAGVGKQTTVRWASKDLGLHVMEVRIFIGSTDPMPYSYTRSTASTSSMIQR